MAHLSDEEREDLTAYLDGELDEEKVRRLEAKLSLDPEARAEADAMKKTWGLLDYLPRAEPSENFTHRTLERLAVRTVTLPRSRMKAWLIGIGWAAAVLLAAGGGWASANYLLWPKPDVEETMVRHLRVVENLHRYDNVEDLDDLKSLDHPDLFGDDSGS
jgi:hypothetical protein